MILERIRERYGANICRRCINDLTGAGLETKDCVYEDAIRQCPRCGDARHIVAELRFRGRRKMAGRRLSWQP